MNNTQTRRTAFSGGLACILLGCCCQAVSAGMIILSAERSIGGSGTQLSPETKSTDGQQTFTESLLVSDYVRENGKSIVGSVSASASQSSSISEVQIRGLGRGSGFGSGPADGSGTSSMRVQFALEEPTVLTMSGQLRLAPHGLGLNGSEAYVRLTGANGTAFEVMMDAAHQPDKTGVVDFTGVGRFIREFPVGEYTLEAMSMGHGSIGLTRCADFDFTLTAVQAAVAPEPAGALCLSFGLVMLSCLRSRRRPF